ncbi:GCN5-related N-acetyltransferase [Devosia sp. H5989]|nr:GCN5-related N-acetyltransferase [Devosia sp. H5989]
MSDIDLKWRVEEACHNAWPATRQVLLHGWVLRMSDGHTKRTNSVNPLRWERREADRIIPEAGALYASLGRKLIFRLPDMAAEIDSRLEALGYAFVDDVTTLVADFSALRGGPEGVELASAPDAAWLATFQAGGNHSEANLAIYRRMLETIVPPRRFASIRQDGQVCAHAYGVIHDGLLVLESVGTAPQFRQKGFGRAVVSSLMHWARDEGAEAACLQVVTDNLPARALYERLGFTRDLYHYHYRIAP